MKRFIRYASWSALLASGAFAQGGGSEAGVPVGPVRISPLVQVVAGYDNRTIQSGGGAREDFFSELEGELSLRNMPARFKLSAGALYGQRFYQEFSDINDDYYTLSAVISTDTHPILFELSTDYDKSLDYRTDYTPSGGAEPDLVLTNAPNIRWVTKGMIGYNRKLSDKLSIKPEYRLNYYVQDLTDAQQSEVAEWYTHIGALELNYYYSDKTRFSLGGEFSLQDRKEEVGRVTSVYIGNESRLTQKTLWSIRLGLSAADYDVSGSEMTGISDLRLMWNTTDKISVYAFAGNRHQPGYGGGTARVVYRGGYGLDWSLLERLSVGAKGLHSYEEGVGGTASIKEEVEHFYDLLIKYRLANSIAINLGLSYTQDDFGEDRLMAKLKIGYRR